MNKSTRGFTIVELLVVIVVIGILATMTIVSYIGISQRAKIASLQSDLSNASKQINLFQSTSSDGNFPTDNDCTSPSETEICLQSSGSNGPFLYSSVGGSDPSYSLILSNGDLKYRVTNDTPITAVVIDPSWLLGVTGTILEGKYVKDADLGGTYQYKTTNTALIEPQGATGLDPLDLSIMVLVSPQANQSVDFSEYPAQNACKAIDGRLPNTQELISISQNKAAYGNNIVDDYYWSATDRYSYPTGWATNIDMSNGAIHGADKVESVRVRCVAD